MTLQQCEAKIHWIRQKINTCSGRPDEVDSLSLILDFYERQLVRLTDPKCKQLAHWDMAHPVEAVREWQEIGKVEY